METATKKQKTVHKKSSFDENYSDNWNTPKSAYELIKPFVKAYQQNVLQKDTLVVFDPFFDKGHAKMYMEEVFDDMNVTILHKEHWVDLKGGLPDFAKDCDVIITNPPFSKNNKLDTTLWMMTLNKPFFSLMPTEFTMAKKFRPFVNEFQFVLPNGRISFEKDGQKMKSAPLSNIWYSYGFQLEKQMNFCM